MIVREHPSSLKLFFVMQGSVVQKIWGKITGIAVLSGIVLVTDQYAFALPHISIAAMGIFGVALSLFLGFPTTRPTTAGGKPALCGER